jgi:hypothetical protein
MRAINRKKEYENSRASSQEYEILPKVRRAAYARLRGKHKKLKTRFEVCIGMCM